MRIAGTGSHSVSIYLLVLGFLLAPLTSMAQSGSCPADSWTATAGNPPAPRQGHTAVWTDAEVIVWGGRDDAGARGDGARYDPETELWTAVTSASAPTARDEHSAVWTGAEMIVWGGQAGGTLRGDGARYDPGTDTWQAIAGAGAPSSRRGHSAVWTGAEMIVWGGQDDQGVLADGARFDPVTNTWSPLSTVNAPVPRHGHTATWTGDAMIVWGGEDASGSAFRSGAIYEPAGNSWSGVNLGAAPAARVEHSATWTGSVMIVWGGRDNTDRFSSGSSYDPASDTWAALPELDSPSPRSGHAAGWSGFELFIWGGESSLQDLDSGARFRPSEDAWLALSPSDAPTPRHAHTATWTSRQFVVWGGEGVSGALATGGAYCACAAVPSADDASCDGYDDDCDGSVDEDYLPRESSCGVGACASVGTTTCTGGLEDDGCTPGEAASSDDTCDSMDDDCDGSIDEDFEDYASSCGVGECSAAGTTSCTGGQLEDDCTPGLGSTEICDGLDNDCDGSIDEDQGTRFVAPAASGGSDLDNTCLDQATPCATISHAIALACDHETISIAEGDYNEDILIDRPLTIDGEGIPTQTILRGSGQIDVVRIFSSDVLWNGVNVYDTLGVACMRIGSSDYPGLRNVRIQNTSLAGCAIGAIWDSTGSPGAEGAWNSFLASSARNNVNDGTPDAGTGTLLVGGNGKIQFKVGRLADNEGAGLIMRAAPEGSANREIVFAGETIIGNGFDPAATSRFGVEIHGAEDLRFEGNDFRDHSDRALWLDALSSGAFFCNRVRDNQAGMLLGGSATGFEIRHNHFTNQVASALETALETGPGITLHENNFSGNGTAISHGGSGALDARHNWWGSSDGPGGSGSGSGDPVSGSVDSGAFISFAQRSVFVRRPLDSGWNASADKCFTKIQDAIDYAPSGNLVLVGPGTFKEHLVLDKPLEIEGTDGEGVCSPTTLDSVQSGGSVLSAFRVSDVSGVSLRHLTISGAAGGLACGSGDELQRGLDLENVSSSTFQDLCLEQNGAYEIRLYGNCDDNLFERLSIDGMTRDMAGEDACAHRSRAGLWIDGGPACEGGAGAVAENNRIVDSSFTNVVHALSLRLSAGTLIRGNTIDSSPATAWPDLTATGVDLHYSQNSSIEDNSIGGAALELGILLAGKATDECVSESADSLATTISGNQLQQAGQTALRIRRAGSDPGRVLGSDIRCNSFISNAEAVRIDDTGEDTDPATQLTSNDISGNNAGVTNEGIRTLMAEGNWWGAATGPGGSGPGGGDSISGAVDYANWLTDSPRSDEDGDGMTECAGDCDDSEATVYEGADELCDALDNDCDGSLDEGFTSATYYQDDDADGFGNADETMEACSEHTPEGYSSDSSDCDDGSDQSYPGAAELCDETDNDCDGSIDEELPLHTWHEDSDGDGYGLAGSSISVCNESAPAGYAAESTDCNDTDPGIHPAAQEHCDDGIDNNCDGLTDVEDSASCPSCIDADTDGYVLCDGSCTLIGGQSCGDCDDGSATIHPGASEVCDEIDNNCDGSIDEGFSTTTWFRDTDGDSYGDPNVTRANCDANPPSGYVSGGGDCNDQQEAIHPAATELCDDGLDNNCDGLIDSEDEIACPPPPACPDLDGDHAAVCDASCQAEEGDVCGDCDDSAALVHPGALEFCDLIDNDCDGSVDEDRGIRYVAPLAQGGSDSGNTCLDSMAPCATISHALNVACDHETISVAEGDYNEDLVIDHPVRVDGSGVPTQTILRGSGSTDVVRILSSDVFWSGVNVYETPGVACMHIGDSAHTGLRRITIQNTSLAYCAIGAIWESTGSGSAQEGDDWNYFLAASTRNNVYDGSPDSGTGTLMIGGNGHIQFKVGRFADNDGAGLIVRPGADGLENREIILAGETIANNGKHPDAGSHVGVEIHDASDVRIEGCDFRDHGAQALLLEDVEGGNFFCNRIRDNDRGLRLAGATQGIDLRQNHFTNQLSLALRVEAEAGSLVIAENIFAGNPRAIEHAGASTLSVPRCWWGSADGAGSTIQGLVDATDFLARDAAPIFVRRPQDSGWSASVDKCFIKLQDAVDHALPGDLLLVGLGTYREHVIVDKALEIQGAEPEGTCSPAVISGSVQDEDKLPALQLTGVSGASLRKLTISGAGKGVPCGDNAGNETGLEVLNSSSSTFQDLCLSENGVTELRVYGDSNDNLFERLDINGMILTPGGDDACGHRSRDGVLVDGGAACEGGSGQIARGNRFVDSVIRNTTRSIVLKLADDTEIRSATIEASPAPAWAADASTGVLISVSNGTRITDSLIGNADMSDGVRIEGRRADACLDERTDAEDTVIDASRIHSVQQAGIRFFRGAADPGAPLGVTVRCCDLSNNSEGLHADYVPSGVEAPSRIENCDVTGNSQGVHSLASTSLLATGNWWGASDGPSGDGSGSGNSVSGAIDYSLWLESSASGDADGDGLSPCGGDCDDTSSQVYPGAAEVCDSIDNDCDGTVDNGAETPGGSPELSLSRPASSTLLSWPSLGDASGYDVVLGDLLILLSSSGDFNAAFESCLASDQTELALDHPALPLSGGGFWYLVRGRNCGGAGSYDSAAAAQAGERDAEVNAAGGACP